MSRAGQRAAGHTAGRVGALLTVTLLAWLTSVTTASADPVLETAVAEVELAADGSATVQLAYRIVADEEGGPVDTVNLSYLDFGGEQPQDLKVIGPGGAELEHESQTSKAKTSATVTLAEALVPGQQGTLDVSYVVPAAQTSDGEVLVSSVPIVTLDHPAATAARDTFTATVHLPTEHRLVEGFPANPEVDTAADGRQVLRYQVPALTSVLRVVSTSGPVTFWTTATQMEAVLGLTIVVGLGLLYVSFVRSQRTAARARATTATVNQN